VLPLALPKAVTSIGEPKHAAATTRQADEPSGDRVALS
jgi:hypothetical protein